jgi:hypothetical protein
MTTKKKILLEGGSGGHMFHPFNLPSVNTGEDLLNFFYKAADFLAKNPEKLIPSDSSSLKVDGANTAFKLVRGPTGLEFAFDRGSMFPIDIEGITIDKLVDPDGTKNHGRWPAGHGMILMGRIMLGALNRALPKIKPELVSLGLLDTKGNPNTTKFINAEFCWKETNAVKYTEDFVAFHGVNQYYEKDYRGIHRPGAVRPLIKDEWTGKMVPTKEKATEIVYDESIMESLKDKVLPYFRDAKGPDNPEGFNVYTVIPVYLKESAELVSKIDSKLEEDLTLRFRVPDKKGRNLDPSSGTVTKSLKDWLSDGNTVNPRATFIKMADGSKKGAMSKEVYAKVLSGMPVEDLVENPESRDVVSAINGALFYYAIENVGATILQGLTSPLGDIITDEMAHEGIVLRNEELFGVKMVKITGNFITVGSSGKFAQDRLSPSEREENPEQGDIENSGDGAAEEFDPDIEIYRIALVPGAFKPPHRGHLRMVEQFANIGLIDKVIILISNPLKRSRTLPSGKVITSEHAKLIWENYIAGSDIGKAEVLISDSASPMTAVYDYIGNPVDDNNPLVAQANSEVFLGCGDKGSDVGRFKESGKYTREDVKVKIVACPLEEKHSSSYMSILQSSEEISSEMPSMNDSSKDPADFHASDMRYLAEKAITNVTARELFSDFTPHGDALAVMGILGLNPVDTQEDEDVYTEVVFNCIDELLVEDFQSKMKTRLCGAHNWFLDQGRNDLTKHGGGFHLDRPKCKSNAFVAKENIEEDEEDVIDEISSMAGGSVEGHSSGAWTGFTDEDNEEEKKRTQQNRN